MSVYPTAGTNSKIIHEIQYAKELIDTNFAPACEAVIWGAATKEGALVVTPLYTDGNYDEADILCSVDNQVKYAQDVKKMLCKMVAIQKKLFMIHASCLESLSYLSTSSTHAVDMGDQHAKIRVEVLEKSIHILGVLLTRFQKVTSTLAVSKSVIRDDSRQAMLTKDIEEVCGLTIPKDKAIKGWGASSWTAQYAENRGLELFPACKKSSNLSTEQLEEHLQIPVPVLFQRGIFKALYPKDDLSSKLGILIQQLQTLAPQSADPADFKECASYASAQINSSRPHATSAPTMSYSTASSTDMSPVSTSSSSASSSMAVNSRTKPAAPTTPPPAEASKKK